VIDNYTGMWHCFSAKARFERALAKLRRTPVEKLQLSSVYQLASRFWRILRCAEKEALQGLAVRLVENEPQLGAGIDALELWHGVSVVDLETRRTLEAMHATHVHTNAIRVLKTQLHALVCYPPKVPEDLDEWVLLCSIYTSRYHNLAQEHPLPAFVPDAVRPALQAAQFDFDQECSAAERIAGPAKAYLLRKRTPLTDGSEKVYTCHGVVFTKRDVDDARKLVKTLSEISEQAVDCSRDLASGKNRLAATNYMDLMVQVKHMIGIARRMTMPPREKQIFGNALQLFKRRCEQFVHNAVSLGVYDQEASVVALTGLKKELAWDV
jgi:hypothetical protein